MTFQRFSPKIGKEVWTPIPREEWLRFQNLEQLFQLATRENEIEVIGDCEKKIFVLLKQIKKIEVSCFFITRK